MQEEMRVFLRERGLVLDPSLTLSENLKRGWEERELTINNLSQQLTRFRCEQIKKEKLIKSLQERINQLAPNTTNTTSNFMMASEFKTHFEEFLTTTLPASLGPLLDRPYLFAKCTHDLFALTYAAIDNQLTNVIGQICVLLRLQAGDKDLKYKIKLSILKILQQFWETVFPLRQGSYQYADGSHQMSEELLTQINEAFGGQEYGEMERQLHKLCVYMLLQEKPWEVISGRGVMKFSKKECTCIDGWVKEGGDTLVVVAGIRREGHVHPNLRNYVVPLAENENCQLYSNLTLINKREKQSNYLKENIESTPHLQTAQQLDEPKVEILLPILQQSGIICKNKSIQFLSNKENYPYAMNKKSKKKEKVKFSVDSSLNCLEKSPKSMIKKHDQSIKNKKVEIEEVDEKIYQIREEKAKKKSLVVSKNLHDDEIVLPLKERNAQELPINKEVHMKKKTKANTSRKNSVGKIINQNHMIHNAQGKDKQNTHNVNTSKMKNKEKVYKDIIKEKLLDQKLDRTQNSFNILFPKARTDREKKKEQNRPLKINHTNKLREKYIF